ncbi:hypothetical protein [Deinococcus roseus]|uniref:hypothetical protein n=1 Tax=Deinococcus roseus TaxID=392414 RepID=UPI00166B8458|nr:hypothetical protein [Deinococcus roseus]
MDFPGFLIKKHVHDGASHVPIIFHSAVAEQQNIITQVAKVHQAGLFFAVQLIHLGDQMRGLFHVQDEDVLLAEVIKVHIDGLKFKDFLGQVGSRVMQRRMFTCIQQDSVLVDELKIVFLFFIEKHPITLLAERDVPENPASHSFQRGFFDGHG